MGGNVFQKKKQNSRKLITSKNEKIAKNISTALVLTKARMEWSSTLMAKPKPASALIIKINQKYTIYLEYSSILSLNSF